LKAGEGFMQDGGEKRPDGRAFYAYRGGKGPAQEKNAAPEPQAADTGQPQYAGAPQDAGEPEGTVERQESGPGASGGRKRGRLPAGAIITILLAAALCAAGVLCDRLGLTNALLLGTVGKQSSAPQAEISGMDAAMYLKTAPWDKKSHGTLKDLAKMKNLRYALEFFRKYPPDRIAAIQAQPSSPEDAIANYGGEAGSMISMEADIVQKYPVTENIELISDEPSALLALGGGADGGGVSMLVLGSSLDGMNAGDSISFKCIPLYCYAPKGGDGSVFLITIPELIASH
jgi:hypothetical protein